MVTRATVTQRLGEIRQEYEAKMKDVLRLEGAAMLLEDILKDLPPDLPNTVREAFPNVTSTEWPSLPNS